MASDEVTKRVPIEVAARISGCSPDEIRRFRKQVLPRPRGSVPDIEMFSAQEVVAMAAGRVARTWRTSANVDQFVARLALKDGDDRDWVAVYESRKGLRVEEAPFTLGLRGAKRGAVFDPMQYYEAFDVANPQETPPT